MARRRKPRPEEAAKQRAQPTSSNVARWLIAAGVMVVTAFVFRECLAGQFLTWDDDHNFLMNTAYRGVDAGHLRWMFTTFYLGPYQPLSWLTLGIDFSNWGMNPYGYHLTNLLLHVLNAGLMCLLAFRLLADDAASVKARTFTALTAASAALLFAIHPLRVEPVAWVTERREVLAGAFTLMTVLGYLRAVSPGGALRSRVWYAGSIVLYAMSLLAKGTAMSLPAALLLLDWWRLRKHTHDSTDAAARMPWRTLVVRQVPFVILGLAATLLAAVGQTTGEMAAGGSWEPWIVRIPRLFYAPVFYAWKTIAPLHLSNLYEVPFRANAFDWHYLLAIAAILVITVIAFMRRSRWPGALAAWLSYLALVAPASGIAHPGGQILADRYTYVPGMVVALLVAGALLSLRAAGENRRLPLAASSGAIAVVLGAAVWLSALTMWQVPVWHDSIALWQHALATHPAERRNDPAAALGQPAYRLIALSLGNALREAGRAEEAVPVLRKGAAASPSDGDIRNSLATSLMQTGRMDEAAPLLEEAVRLDPTHAEAYFNLGIARASQGRAADAIQAYDRATELDPSNAVAFYNLGVLLADAGHLEEAAARYRQAIAIKPDYGEAFNNLGVALGRLGRTREAADAFQRAVTLDPANASARQNLAVALEALKRGR